MGSWWSSLLAGTALRGVCWVDETISLAGSGRTHRRGVSRGLVSSPREQIRHEARHGGQWASCPAFLVAQLILFDVVIASAAVRVVTRR